MKRMVCEVCTGTNILKYSGVFECRDCGCKYTLEEARNLLVEVPDEAAPPLVHDKKKIEETVPEKGIEIMTSEEDLIPEKTLGQETLEITEEVSTGEDWRERFYRMLREIQTYDFDEVPYSAKRFGNLASESLSGIQRYVKDAEERTKAVRELGEQVEQFVEKLTNFSSESYQEMDAAGRKAKQMDYLNNSISVNKIPTDFGCKLCELFAEDEVVFRSAVGVFLKNRLQKGLGKPYSDQFLEAIHRFEPEYVVERPKPTFVDMTDRRPAKSSWFGWFKK